MLRSKAFIRLLAALILLALTFVIGRATAPVKVEWIHDLIPSTAMPVVMIDQMPKPVVSDSFAVKSDNSPESIAAALERIGDNPSSEAKFNEMLDWLMRWARQDPAAALNYVLQHFQQPSVQDRILTAMLAEAAKVHPQATWDWAMTNVPTNLQYVDALLNQVGKIDSNVAWKFALDYAAKYPANADTAYAGALRGMAFAGNYEAAAQLIENANLIQPSGNGFNLANLLVSQWARYAPDAAATWVQTLPEGEIRNLALSQLGSAWSESDPQAAANFAMQLSDGTSRQMMLSQVIGNWVGVDPADAAAWANQFASTPDFDQTLATISTLPGVTMDVAFGWANSITEKELRIQSLTKIFQQAMRSNPDIAIGYLKQSDLSPDIRDQVEQRLGVLASQ